MTGPRPPIPGPPRPGPMPGPPRPAPSAPPASPVPGPPPAAWIPTNPGPAAASDARAGDVDTTGHPAVDAVLRSLANAAPLAPAEQIAEYEAAHQVLQETLASIDRS